MTWMAAQLTVASEQRGQPVPRPLVTGDLRAAEVDCSRLLLPRERIAGRASVGECARLPDEVMASSKPHLPMTMWMRTRTILVLGTALLTAGTARADAQARYCRAADSYGPALVADLTKLVTATDAGIRAARDSFYHVPVVAAPRIALVTDERTCRRALQALVAFEESRPARDTMAGTPKPALARAAGRRVVVVRHGTFWAVEDPDAAPDGRFMTVVLFDAKWRQVGGYSGP